MSDNQLQMDNQYFAIQPAQTSYGESLPLSSTIFSDEDEETLKSHNAMASRLCKKIESVQSIILSVNIDQMILKNEGDYFLPLVEKIIWENLREILREKKPEPEEVKES